MSTFSSFWQKIKDFLRSLKGKTPYIEISHDTEWSNWHKTLNVGGRVVKLFKPFNEYNDKSSPPNGKEFIPGLEGLQQIIKEGKDANANVRAHGSKWSLNNVAFTHSFLVDSKNLNFHKIGIDDEQQLTGNYKSKKDSLSFVQCGLMVKELNQALKLKGQSLITSGASDGQTLIGAVSTGTHGGANQVGAMTEFVRGIHLVVSDKHVFIQRASDPAVTSKFCDWLSNAEHKLDDDLFNAALVSFGSFGLIHGLLIETEPQYCLERIVKNFDVPDVRDAITNLDMSGLGLPQGDTLPFHFEVAINPYRVKQGENGAFVRVYYKKPISDLPPIRLTPIGTNHDTHSAVASAFDQPADITFNDIKTLLEGDDIKKKRIFIGAQVQFALALSFRLTDPNTKDIRLPSEFFTSDSSSKPSSSSPIAATSLEIGIPLEEIGAAVDLVISASQSKPFAAPLALRYVKKSSATIGFTGLGDTTVTMEMPGPYGELLYPNTGNAHEALFEHLEASDIKHSYHWGQQFPKRREWAQNAYGQKLEDWKSERLKFLSVADQELFWTPFIDMFIDKGQSPTVA